MTPECSQLRNTLTKSLLKPLRGNHGGSALSREKSSLKSISKYLYDGFAI